MDFIYIVGIATLLGVFTLAIALVFKMERVRQLEETVRHLKKSLDEMDEQARLIVRTDMELNKTQEELDKKIGGLYALQRLSRRISTTLEEKEVFKLVEAEHLEELGFEKTCAFLWDKQEKKFIPQIDIGYTPRDVEEIKLALDKNRELYLDLINHEKGISSISVPIDPVFKEKVDRVFKVSSFIISPLLPKEGNRGLLFVGTLSQDTMINEGDEELIAILANQLGQAIENARLFEKTWRAHQELERKIEERTRELTAALNAVKSVSKRKTDFISSVSHELRTPLTSIKGYASILLAGKLGNIPAEIKERLDKINRHSDELVHLVNELLDIARIESGKMTMKKETLDLKNVVAEVTDLLAVQLKEKQIDFSADIDKQANSLSADRSQFQRMLINIIGNALKFTPQKGKISLAAKKIGEEIQIDISDTGCGIPEEAKEAIFEEFYRVDNPINEAAKGTGLGLSLVKHIIEAHKGKIWVKSKLGAGSTFSFTIPKGE